MTQRLIKRLSALGQYEEAVAALNAVALERPASLKSKQAAGQRSDVLGVCDDAFVLAQQLTHIELVGRPAGFFFWGGAKTLVHTLASRYKTLNLFLFFSLREFYN